MNKTNKIALLMYSACLAIGMLVCGICDVAFSGILTWSLIPISSIGIMWFIGAPLIAYGKRAILFTLIAVSVLSIPYLYILSKLTNEEDVFSIGRTMALISIVFIWIVYAVFRCLKQRKLLASGVSFMLGIPLVVIINYFLSKYTGEPIVDVWDIFSMIVLLLIAITFFVCYYKKDESK